MRLFSRCKSFSTNSPRVLKPGAALFQKATSQQCVCVLWVRRARLCLCHLSLSLRLARGAGEIQARDDDVRLIKNTASNFPKAAAAADGKRLCCGRAHSADLWSLLGALCGSAVGERAAGEMELRRGCVRRPGAAGEKFFSKQCWFECPDYGVDSGVDGGAAAAACDRVAGARPARPFRAQALDPEQPDGAHQVRRLARRRVGAGRAAPGPGWGVPRHSVRVAARRQLAFHAPGQRCPVEGHQNGR